MLHIWAGWHHTSCLQLITLMANIKSALFIWKWSRIHIGLTYYVSALRSCRHGCCLRREQHISAFIASLPATGSSLMPFPPPILGPTEHLHLSSPQTALPCHFSTQFLISCLSDHTCGKQLVERKRLDLPTESPKGVDLWSDVTLKMYSYHLWKWKPSHERVTSRYINIFQSSLFLWMRTCCCYENKSGPGFQWCLASERKLLAAPASSLIMESGSWSLNG